MVAPRVRAGIKIAAIKGTPHGAAFAEEVARAFREADIAAQAGPGPSPGLTLVGRALAEPGATPSQTRVRVLWRILDAEGGPAGFRHQDQTVDAGAWAAGARPLLRRLAREAVSKIGPLIADPRRTAGTAPLAITVLDVAGAPGDGRVSLRRSLAYELEKRGFKVSQSRAARPGALTLKGTVVTRPRADEGGGRRIEVEITWTVLGPAGRVLGTVKQANALEARSVDGNWGVNAALAARAAAPGIARIIHGATAQAAPRAP